jgi:hypothetical protein
VLFLLIIEERETSPRSFQSVVFFKMGCGSSLFSPYTLEETEAEIAQLVPRLPVAELMNGGIIKLEGANGFFNPNSLLDPSWLKGKLTPEEYRAAIDLINKLTAHSHIGLRKMYTASDRPVRENLRTQAGMAAVQELNQRYPSVRFTYQPTAENMQVNTSWSTDPTVKFATRGRAPIANASVTALYIAVQ